MAEASPILSEHEAPQRESNTGADVYEPTPEERKAIRLVNKLLSKNKKHRSQYDKKWLDYYRMFRGKQWKEQRPSYRHTEVVNLVFRTIQSTVPIQVDARPRFEFMPQEPMDREVAEILNTVAEADWIKKNWGEQLLEVIYDSNIYGTGLSCMKGEPNEITYESIDPVYCYPDPEARDVNNNCTNFVYAEPLDVGRIKRKWKDKAKFIKPDIESLMKSEKSADEIVFRSPADRNMVMEGSTPLDPSNKDLALVITAYLTAEMCEEDFDEEERPLLGDDGSPVMDEMGNPKSEFVQIAKYPKGRKIVTCGNVLLEDGPNPYDDGEIPYHRYPNYILPREFWGMSEVEQLEGPQRVFNKMVSFALDVMTLMGNPVWLIPTSTGVDPDNLVNRPGLNVEYDGDNPPRREEGVQLQPFVLQMIDKMADWFDSISGSQDVTRGVNPTGVTAASAISSLQEAAQTRIRQKARNLDFYLQSVGQQYKSRVFQFYSAPQIIRLTNNANAQKYFKMYIETYDKEDGTIGRRMSVTPYTDRGQEDLLNARQYEIMGDFDVKVATGSSLPFAKAEKENKLKDLFKLGIIDDEEVLKGSDYPNWQGVLQRMQEKKALEAQAALAAAPQGNALPPAA